MPRPARSGLANSNLGHGAIIPTLSAAKAVWYHVLLPLSQAKCIDWGIHFFCLVFPARKSLRATHPIAREVRLIGPSSRRTYRKSHCYALDLNTDAIHNLHVNADTPTTDKQDHHKSCLPMDQALESCHLYILTDHLDCLEWYWGVRELPSWKC